MMRPAVVMPPMPQAQPQPQPQSMMQPPQLQQQHQGREGRTWESYLNIAIEDTKDFREEVCPVTELYSEFATTEGHVIFGCTGLTKDTGIDLLDCPLTVSLKLHVKRTTSHGDEVLYHVILPMPLISKHLLPPPHEWRTWIGMLPTTISLESHPPDVMFTQAVHLISRPEFPKLRLRFRYHNPEMERQIMAQQEIKDQESRRKKDFETSRGKQTFEDLRGLMQSVRGGSSASTSTAAAAAQGPGHLAHGAVEATVDRTADSAAHRDALATMVGFVDDMAALLARLDRGGNGAANPTAAQLLASGGTSPDPRQLEAHCSQIRRRIEEAVSARGGAAVGDGGRGSSGAAIAEPPQLAEALRLAIMGMIDDSPEDTGHSLPRTMTNLSIASNDSMSSVQVNFPKLWEVCREVSSLAKHRASLLEEHNALTTQLLSTRQLLERNQLSESKKQFEKLLAQQRQSLQHSFDKEVSAMRLQLEDERRAVREKENEVKRLSALLAEHRRAPGQ